VKLNKLKVWFGALFCPPFDRIANKNRWDTALDTSALGKALLCCAAADWNEVASSQHQAVGLTWRLATKPAEMQLVPMPGVKLYD